MENKILLIEDDTAISEMVKGHLSKEGFLVSVAMDGAAGITCFYKEAFDLVLLDIMMPKLDGMEVMRLIREKSQVPILIMSAKDSDVDKAVGLGLGADDYIAKPFSLIEISARIKAAIRRSTTYSTEEKKKANVISLHQLTIDLDNFSVHKKGQSIQLTSKEFDILRLFITNPNRVFTKNQIFNFVWNGEYMGDENIISVHMRRLREKIEDDPSNPCYIKTLWGIGYKLGEV